MKSCFCNCYDVDVIFSDDLWQEDYFFISKLYKNQLTVSWTWLWYQLGVTEVDKFRLDSVVITQAWKGKNSGVGGVL